MNRHELMPALTDVFREVFHDPLLSISAATAVEDIEGWDSLTHIAVIIAAEQAFGIHFKASEMDRMHDVGAFAQLIAAKRAVAAL